MHAHLKPWCFWPPALPQPRASTCSGAARTPPHPPIHLLSELRERRRRVARALEGQVAAPAAPPGSHQEPVPRAQQLRQRLRLVVVAARAHDRAGRHLDQQVLGVGAVHVGALARGAGIGPAKSAGSTGGVISSCKLPQRIRPGPAKHAVVGRGQSVLGEEHGQLAPTVSHKYSPHSTRRCSLHPPPPSAAPTPPRQRPPT